MTKTIDVAVIVGSRRKGSINRMVANAFIELALADLKLGIVEIGQLQLYNQDLDDQHLDQSEGYVCSAVGRGRRDDIEPGRLRAI